MPSIILIYTILLGFIFGLFSFLIHIFAHDIILCGLLKYCFFQPTHFSDIIKFSITGSFISLIILFFSVILIYFVYGKNTLEAIISKKDWTH
uniref:Uncharacterized protein n=1 Tax=Borely moumouvirus TaxID=2712067 RepID=A0A6G6AAJ1_9VIRU